MKNKIYIVDSKSSNILSIYNALKYLGYDVEVTINEKKILSENKLIFPGVGSYDYVCDILKKKKLYKVLKDCLKEKYSLSICVGMQMLFKGSEEGESSKGFLYINSKVKKFDDKCIIPNISWLNLKIIKKDNILDGIDPKDKFYFVHSYKADLNKFTICSTKYYNETYSSLVKYKKAYGCQFHPELSGESGLKFLKNFCKL